MFSPRILRSSSILGLWEPDAAMYSSREAKEEKFWSVRSSACKPASSFLFICSRSQASAGPKLSRSSRSRAHFFSWCSRGRTRATSACPRDLRSRSSTVCTWTTVTSSMFASAKYTPSSTRRVIRDVTTAMSFSRHSYSEWLGLTMSFSITLAWVYGFTSSSSSPRNSTWEIMRFEMTSCTWAWVAPGVADSPRTRNLAPKVRSSRAIFAEA
mmetsp:Transcript_14540/g.41313  ORF Transcript_14540/g.41313 Transcript_14540/m.41313 type:complete len:212 (+) Transcript_14540:982-1617(+)